MAATGCEPQIGDPQCRAGHRRRRALAGCVPGADEALLNQKDGGVTDVDALRRDFWRPTPEARREALMPFFWNVIARQGQIYGNRDKGSPAKVANGMNFSYPGYNELLTGWPDPRIDSNDKVPNPNVTVFEWLNRKPAYRGKVTAVGCVGRLPFYFQRPAQRALHQRRLGTVWRAPRSRRARCYLTS